jgi:hypothetical protein
MTRTASPAYFVVEGDGGINAPAIPTLDQMSGAAFTDDTAYPPIPDQQPTAADWNQVSFTAWADTKLTPKLTVGITGGVSPTINSVIAANRNISTTTGTSSNGDVAVSHVGTGHYTITVTYTKLPPQTCPPKAHANVAGAAAASAFRTGAGVVDVYVSNNSGLIEGSFTLDMSGY